VNRQEVNALKSSIGIISILSITIIAAFYIAFRPFGVQQPIAYDHEQEGMKERITIRFSHVVAENTPKGLAAIKFANAVRERLGDRVEVQVYPNAILYNDAEAIHALERGDIEMIAPAFSYLTDSFPAWMAMDLPFAFADQDDVNDALQGDIGEHLFHTLEKRNLQGLAFWNNGFKQMTSSKRALLLPEDFQGQRIRVLPSQVIEAQFRMLRAKPIVLPFSEVYGNLEDGSIDGQENTISNIYTKKMYKVQNYMTVSNHGYLGYAVITNRSFWSKLPDDVRVEMEYVLKETTDWMNQFAVYINDEQLKEIQRTSDIEITELSPEERDEWIQRLDPLYDQFAPAIGKDLVQQVRRFRNERNRQ
jgi:tripartite ATP-independent transporter DctP family solute receptor